MSGNHNHTLDFDKLFYILLYSDVEINQLIEHITSPKHFIAALTDHMITLNYALNADQWARVLSLSEGLEKIEEPGELSDLSEGLDEDDSDIPSSVGSVRLGLPNKQYSTNDQELDDIYKELDEIDPIADDETIGSRSNSDILADLDDLSDSTISSNPNSVKIEITPAIITIIQEDIKKTLNYLGSMDNENPEIKKLVESAELKKILESIQSNENPTKSLAELSILLSQQKIPEVRQLGNSLSEKWFYILPTNTKGFGESYEAKDNDFVKRGYHQLLHIGNQLLIELYGTKDINEFNKFIEKCKTMPLYQELLVNNREYEKLYEEINKKIPGVATPPKNERQNLLTAIHCVMWSINHISSLQGTTMERGSFKIIDPDNRLYDMLTSYTKLVNQEKLPNASIVMVNPLSYTRQDNSLLGKHLSTHDPMCETLGCLYGIDSRPKGNSSLMPLLPEGRQHSIVGISDIEGEYPTTTIKWELFGIGKKEDMWHHIQNLKEMKKLQAEGKLGKSTATGKSYRETEFPKAINDKFIEFLEKITANSSQDPFGILDLNNALKALEAKETKETKAQLKAKFKKLMIHKMYDFMEEKIQSSEPPLKEELMKIKNQLEEVANQHQLDHQKIRAGSEIILDFSKFCLLKNNLQDLLTINQNASLAITETIGSSKESTKQLSSLYAKLSAEPSSSPMQNANSDTNSDNLKTILREIFISENPDYPPLSSEIPHLYIAAQLRKINTNIAEKLLKRFPEIPSYKETTPLLLATNLGNNNVVQALLENSTICDKLIDEKCTGKYTPLETALNNSHTYIIATLLQHGAKIGDINSYNIEQQKHLLSELHKAERSQDNSIMEQIRAKNPNIQDIITQLEEAQQQSLKTSVEPSLQSPRSLRLLSSVANMAQSFRFKPNPQSPSSSPRKQRMQLSQAFSPTTNRTWVDTDSTIIGSDGVQSPSLTNHNSGMPDANQRLVSDSNSPATSPKNSRLARLASIFKQKVIKSPQATSSPQSGSTRRANYVQKFDDIRQIQQSDSDEKSISQNPNGSVTPEPIPSSTATNPHKNSR